jgi:hypothetical protein
VTDDSASPTRWLPGRAPARHGCRPVTADASWRPGRTQPWPCHREAPPDATRRTPRFLFAVVSPNPGANLVLTNPGARTFTRTSWAQCRGQRRKRQDSSALVLERTFAPADIGAAPRPCPPASMSRKHLWDEESGSNRCRGREACCLRPGCGHRQWLSPGPSARSRSRWCRSRLFGPRRSTRR